MSRVSPGLLLIGFFAILAGLGAAYGVRRALQKPAPVPPAPEKLMSVIVASIDLPRGRIVRNSDFLTLNYTSKQFAAQKWPALMLADGKQIVGRTVMSPIEKGRPFQPESFFPEGTGPDPTESLRPGFRAVALSIPVTGIPNHATPGSIVDVVFRSTASKDDEIPEVTRVLVHSSEILAIGDSTTRGLFATYDPKAEEYRVMLAVTEEQAIRLKVAEGHGNLSLSLRPTADPIKELSSNLTLRQVLDLPPPAVVIPEPPEPPPFVAEIYRGGHRQVLTFGPLGLISNSAIPRRLPPSSTRGPRIQSDQIIPGDDSDIDRSLNPNPSSDRSNSNDQADAIDPDQRKSRSEPRDPISSPKFS